MYVLICQLHNEAKPIAVSESVNLLKQKLVRDAKRILRDYLQPDDPGDQRLKKELFDSLNNLADATEWSDGDSLDPLVYYIKKAPLLKVK